MIQERSPSSRIASPAATSSTGRLSGRQPRRRSTSSSARSAAATRAVVAGGVAFYVSLLVVMYVARHIHGGEPEDEIAGLERNLEHWKL